METYLQYRRIGKVIRQQLESNNVETARQLPFLSRQETRVVNGRAVLIVGWDAPDDPMNPRNWPKFRRVYTTLIISAIALMVGLAAPIDATVLPQAAKDLHVSEVAESLAVGVFLVGFGLGALLVGPFSEVLGRNATYIVSLASMCIWLMASALAPNFGAQVVFRFLAGFSGATPLVCAGGSVSDMFTPLEKTYMFPVFAIPGFLGPPLASVMGAWIPGSPYLHTWRWTEWVALLTGGVVFFLTFLFQPETFPPLLLSWKAKHLRAITGDDRYYAEHELEHVSVLKRLRVALPRPFIMAFREPVISLICLYMTVLYIILFTFFDGYDYIFRQTYNISQGLSNTIFIGIAVGILFGAVWLPWIYKKTVRAQAEAESKGRKQFDPEIRLWFAMLGGAPAIPVSLFWMGWSASPNVSIWSPIMASVLFGYGVIMIFISSYMYIIDSYEMYAASALTFATLSRYCVAGGMVVVGVPFYSNVGMHWTLTIMGCLSLLLAPIPYVFYKYGHLIRKKSRFAVNRAVEEEPKPVVPESSGSSSMNIPIEREDKPEEGDQGWRGTPAVAH
ncbi:MFS transporter [Exophiala viscosa]|uniref:MFS transporter n=1 Tax=Exophiala viscosa TaxID=2486360 RepID=UPI00219D80FC|nr:MFS transporter [Exophiala viscosa]